MGVGLGVGVGGGPGFAVAEGDAKAELGCADPPPQPQTQPQIAKNAVKKNPSKMMRSIRRGKKCNLDLHPFSTDLETALNCRSQDE